MNRSRPLLRRFAALFAWGALASGAPAADAQVRVRLGPAVQARSRELGAGELEAERAQLERAVTRALARAGATAPAPARIDLVIADLQPSRATSAELGASTGLSPFTRGLGGAAITGQVVAADGTAAPVRYRWFPPNLQSQLDTTEWGDAENAFDHLAALIASGRPPDDSRPWPPPHPPSTPTGTRIPS